jgi:hypothetical protein
MFFVKTEITQSLSTDLFCFKIIFFLGVLEIKACYNVIEDRS